VSGTYFLTSETFYPGASPTPATDQQTAVMDATAGTIAFVDTRGGMSAYLAGTFTTSSANWLLTGTCGTGPDGGIIVVPGATAKTGNTYTATSTTFTIFSSAAAGSSVSVYTKQ
jgi:hypothetical protein